MRRGLLFGFAALVPLAGIALLPARKAAPTASSPVEKCCPERSRRCARDPGQPRTGQIPRSKDQDISPREQNVAPKDRDAVLPSRHALPVRTPGKKIVGRRASHGRPKESLVSATRIAAIQLVRRLGAMPHRSRFGNHVRPRHGPRIGGQQPDGQQAR